MSDPQHESDQDVRPIFDEHRVFFAELPGRTDLMLIFPLRLYVLTFHFLSGFLMPYRRRRQAGS